MTELNPNDRDRERTVTEPEVLQERESSWTTLGIAIALAVAVAIGAYFLGFRENDIFARNGAPPVTTGQSSSAPAPASGNADNI